MSQGLDLMRQMRRKRDDETEFKEWGNPYSYLNRKKGLQRTFWWLLLLISGVIGFIMYQKVSGNIPWTVIAGPVTILGLILAVYPQYEEWHYGPWQSRSQKCERHIVD